MNSPYAEWADALDKFGTIVASGEVPVDPATGLEVYRVAEMATRAVALMLGKTPQFVLRQMREGAPDDSEWRELLPEIQLRGMEAVAQMQGRGNLILPGGSD